MVDVWYLQSTLNFLFVVVYWWVLSFINQLHKRPLFLFTVQIEITHTTLLVILAMINV